MHRAFDLDVLLTVGRGDLPRDRWTFRWARSIPVGHAEYGIAPITREDFLRAAIIGPLGGAVLGKPLTARELRRGLGPAS